MKTTIKDTELHELMSEVQKELDVILKAEQEKLAKAHPGEETSSEVPADESATSASSDGDGDADDSGPPAADESAPPSADASAPPAADAAPPADASAPPADGSADPGADQGLNPEQLKAEYAQLPLEELKMHYLAAKEALFAAMGAGGDPAAAGGPPADASAPPAPPAAASPPPAPPPAASAPPVDDQSAPPALKAEKQANNPANGGKVTTVAKSEKDLEIEDLRKKLGDLEEIVPSLIDLVKVAAAPARKAVTSVAQLEKSNGVDVGSLSKAEIDARLKRAVRTNLTNPDREAINSYYLSGGATGIEGIKHILASVK
jgi:hypothetical protein